MTTNPTTVSVEDEDCFLPAIVVDGVKYILTPNTHMEEEEAGNNAIYWECRARAAFLDCIKSAGYEKKS